MHAAWRVSPSSCSRVTQVTLSGTQAAWMVWGSLLVATVGPELDSILNAVARGPCLRNRGGSQQHRGGVTGPALHVNLCAIE